MCTFFILLPSVCHLHSFVLYMYLPSVPSSITSFLPSIVSHNYVFFFFFFFFSVNSFFLLLLLLLVLLLLVFVWVFFLFFFMLILTSLYAISIIYQVGLEFERLATDLSVFCIYGGMPYEPQGKHQMINSW